MSEINWHIRKFELLSPHELYAILQLRNEVFVVEQNCVFQDADNKDKEAVHIMGTKEDKLIAYTRILPPGIAYAEPSIGRVVTSPAVRKTGMGKTLMEVSIAAIKQLYGECPIRIGAQLYLQNFYSSFGFRTTGDTYLEDNIPHIEMVRS